MVATLLASFLPWAASGARLRDSHELVAVAGRLDLVPDPLTGPSAAWSLLPLCAVLTCVAVVLRRTWATAILSLVVGVAAVGLASAVVSSPLGVKSGAVVSIGTGVLSVLGALMVVAESKGERRARERAGGVGPARGT